MRGLGLGLGILGRGTRGDVDVAAWQLRVLAAGGTVSQPTLRAASTMVRTLKTAGIWSRVSRLNLFAGDQLTACLVPLIVGAGNATDTNVNFVAGDYTEATGLSGDGATKYLDTGWAGYALTGGMSVYLRTALAAVGQRLIGARNVASTQIFTLGKSTGTETAAVWGQASVLSQTETTGPAFYHAKRAAPTDFSLYKNGSSIGSSAVSVTPASPGSGMYVFCGNNGSNVAELPTTSGAKLAGYAIDDGTMSVADETTWNTAWQTFQAALGRAV